MKTIACTECNRVFPDNKKSLPRHKRWCGGPGTGDVRSRNNQILDKAIKSEKRKKYYKK